MTALYSPATEGYEVLFPGEQATRILDRARQAELDGPPVRNLDAPPFDATYAELEREDRAWSSAAEQDFAADREWGRRHLNV